jgi:hypothetical protein
MRVAVFIALSFALAACGRANEEYPPAYEINFTRACEAQGTERSVCACIWAKVEADIPRRDFEAFERATGPARTALPAQRQIEGFAHACADAP